MSRDETNPPAKQAASSDAGPEPLNGGQYVAWGWQAISRDPFLPIFEAAAAVLTYVIAPLFFFASIGLASARLSALVDQGREPLNLMTTAVQSPTFWLGLFGIAASVWLVQFCLTSAITGGTRGTVARALRGETVDPVGSFVGEMPDSFPAMIGFRLFRGIGVGIASLMAMGTLVAVIRSLMDASGPGGWHIVLQSFWLTLPVAFALIFIIVVRVGIDCAVGPLFCSGRPVPTAIADGLRFFVERFALVYRILAAGAIVLLVPLVGVWLISMLALLIPVTGPLGTVGGIVRLAAQGLLVMLIPVAGLLISSGLMAAWYHLEEEGRPPGNVATDST